MLGVELALRAARWRDRIAPWFLAGLAISQMFVGWLGQGLVNGLLVVASYLGYRALLSPPRPGRDLRARLMVGVATGVAILGLASAVGAAGILPRFDLNAETNLAGGRYDELVGSHNAAPYPLLTLLHHVVGDGYGHRAVALGGAAVVLALLAPVFAGRRFAVPYFAVMTLVVFTLSLDTTPLHHLFYLIPRFRVLHEHAPHQVNAVVMIGPAILAAATVERLAAWRGRRRLLPLVGIPLLAMTAVVAVLQHHGRFVGWPPLAAAAVVTGLIALVVATPRNPGRTPAFGRLPRWVAALILAVAVVQPTGQEVVESWLGRTLDPGWARFWPADPTYDRAVAVNVARTDPGGAGEFLQARQRAETEPFRYVGYGGVAHPDEGPRPPTYQHRRTEPNVQAILVNARAVRLGLFDIQGYKAVQLKRYVEFLTALNGATQEYHVANLRPTGVRSPLLDLLNVRYVVVDATLPQDREDIVALAAGRREVFRNEAVVVYENEAALPRAWIVHEVRPVARGEALAPLASGTVNPRRVAFVEGSLPVTSPPPGPAAESARLTRYEPDALTIDTEAAAPGLLVVSEAYSDGWRAFVDGESAPVLPTNHALRGVPIPAGEHRVELRYEPRSLQLGLWISAVASAAMLVAFAAAGWARVRRTRPGRSLSLPGGRVTARPSVGA
ncbi:MAG: YfhO family protein [Chloroflexota bacterium]|nr:YfhO family protein [Chloroflexota bacterium]